MANSRENFRTLTLLDSNTNSLYEMYLTDEIYARANTDFTFAKNLLQFRVDYGIEVFDGPIEDFDVQDTPQDRACSSSPAETTKEKSGCSTKINEDNKKTEVYNWSKEDVLLLIATYKDHQLLFLDDNMSKAEAWEKVITDITVVRAQQYLPSIDVKKCKTKMDALKRHYKRLKDSTKKSGNKENTWPYYDEMEELFAEQPWVKPLSTAGSNVADGIKPETIDRPTKRQKTLKNFCEELTQDRKRRAEIRSQEHLEKVAAVNRLTDVIAQLVANPRQNDTN